MALDHHPVRRWDWWDGQRDVELHPCLLVFGVLNVRGIHFIWNECPSCSLSALRLTGWISYNACFPFIKPFPQQSERKTERQISCGRDDTSAFWFIGHWWYSKSLKAGLEPRKQHYWSPGVLLPEIVLKSLTQWCVALWQRHSQEQPFLEISKLRVPAIWGVYWEVWCLLAVLL